MIGVIQSGEVIGWVVLVGGLTLSFLYSGLETGTYVVNKIRLDLLADAGSRRAIKLQSALRGKYEPLGVLLIGNNLANYIASMGIVMILTFRNWTHPGWSAMFILTPIVFVFCELLPKSLFQRYGETITYKLSSFLDFSRRVFTLTGLVGLLGLTVQAVLRCLGEQIDADADNPFSGSSRIATIIAEGRASGAITQAQSVMANRIVNISNVTLSDVMIHIDKAVLVPKDATRQMVYDLLKQNGHPRMGVYSGSRRNIVGVLNAYDVLLSPSDMPIEAHITEAVKLPQQMNITEALIEMRQKRTVIAFVVNPSGQCVGLITIKDLVEEIVGELQEW